MQFDVHALDSHQRLVRLLLEAPESAAVESLLRDRGLQLVSATARAGLKTPGQRFPLHLFAQELRALLVAGLSVIEALGVLLDKALPSAQREVLLRLDGALREGRRFSQALALQPECFSPLFIGMLRAAEGSSDLPEALGRYLDYEDRMGGVRQRIVSAAVYPSILVVVGGGVALFLMMYVVPRFAAIYQTTGQNLPLASRLLLDWGRFASAHAWPLALGVLTLVILAVGRIRHHWRAGTWIRVLALLPGAGSKLQVLELTRLYLTLGVLLRGGMPISAALSLAKEVLPVDRRAALVQAQSRIEEGVPVAEALQAAGLTVPVAQRLLQVGERSGQLGEMLIRAAEFHDNETARWIERFTKAFEPALMAAIGVVVGLIVVLLYLPIFDLAGAVQ